MKKIINSIKIDKKNNSFKSFIVLLFYRLMNYSYKTKHIGIRLAFLKVLKEIVFSIIGVNAQISYKAEIGDNIKLPHSAIGLVISGLAKISDNQIIYHQVTIGVNDNLPLNKQGIIIKENCLLSAGCKIISSTVGKNCKIGPNAVVYKDLPNNSLWVSTGEFINRK